MVSDNLNEHQRDMDIIPNLVKLRSNNVIDLHSHDTPHVNNHGAGRSASHRSVLAW